MDIFEQKLEEMNFILEKHGLGLIYDVENDRENGLLMPFFCMFMDSVNQVGLNFCITTELSIRCGIIHHEKLVFMSYGMFDRLCKLSELIARSGVITVKEMPLNFHDLHFVANPFVGFNNEDREEDELESHFFMFVLECLMLFIVSHEVGHFINKHGNRETLRNFDGIFDDVLGHREISEAELIASHARELVADCFAFNIVRNHIESVFERKDDYLNNLLPVFDGEKGGVLLSLLIIVSYFKLTDGLSPHEHFKSTHPSTGARVRFILSCYVGSLVSDEEIEEVSDEEIEEFAPYYNILMMQLNSIFKLLGYNSENTWLKSTSSPEMIAWFDKVYIEYPNWKAK
ncbi:hypothetical protein [Pantoea agglomerans]|uniref:hypothetical protein n=1 Tax=Enterobacter agglomerans TaxID=549 RepID=UPI0016542FA7|nr:hypothetical protein [Pantoea agglomerans]